MRQARPQHRKPDRAAEREQLPPGTPAWITTSLIDLTLKVWQPYYKEPLSSQDAVTIVLNVGKLIGILSRE